MANIGLPIQTLPGTVLSIDGLKEGGSILSQEALYDRILREGDPYTGVSQTRLRWSGNGSSGGQQVGDPFSSISVVKGIFLETLMASASEDVLYQSNGPHLTNLNGSVMGSSAIQSSQFIVGAKKTICIPYRMLFNRHQKPPTLALLRAFDQDPSLTIPEITANVTLGFTHNNGSLYNTVVGSRYSRSTEITNNSGSATSGAIIVKDILPEHARVISTSGNGWSITIDNGVLTATTNDVLANGATKTFTVVFEPTKTILGTGTYIGYLIDLDIALNAPPIWYCGTSITAGSSASYYSTHFTYLLKAWLRDQKSIITRVFNRGIGGAASPSQELLRSFGNRYETLELPEMAFYEEGINDSAQNVPTEVTIANMKAYVYHVRRKSAECPILIAAPLPTVNVTNESKNQILHGLFSSEITNMGDTNLYYVSGLRNLWNPITEGSTYTPDGVHPNDAGNQKIFEVISNFISANNIF